MGKLDELAERLLAERQKRGNPVIFVNRKLKEYSVVDFGPDWEPTSEKPFDLIREGYSATSKHKAGF